MRIIKYTLTVFVLITITVGIISVPRFINNHKQEALLNETFHRNYYEGSRSKLTSEQVALLYYNEEVLLRFNSLPSIVKNTDMMRGKVTEVLKLLFSENESVLKSLTEALSYDEVIYDRNNILIKHNGQPTALNFVSYTIYGADAFFDIVYEEKTKTIIRISFRLSRIRFSSDEDIESSVSRITSTISRYYEQQLNLNKDCFVIQSHPVVMYQEDKFYLTNFSFDCKLKQKSDNTSDVEFEIYN